MRRVIFVVVMFSSAAVGNDFPRDTSAITSLTAEEAELLLAMQGKRISLTEEASAAGGALAEPKGSLALDGMTALSGDAATALAKFKGHLSLNGLTSLTDEVAVALSKHGGELSLNGLTTLAKNPAKSLSRHEGRFLSLAGLTALSDEAAAELANYQGGRLVLDGLDTVSDTAVESLQQIPRVQLPEKFRRTQGENGGVIGPEYAKAMVSQHEGVSLDLRKWQRLAPGAADELRRHRGRGLLLSDVRHINARDATALAKYKSMLCLGAVTTLSDDAAFALATYRGRWLNLSSLNTISDEGVAALRKNRFIILPEKLKR